MIERKKIAMLGGGFIGDFDIHALHGQRRTDLVHIVYSRSESSAKKVAERHGIPHWTTDITEAVNHPDIDTVIVALPNFQHLEAARLVAEAGKAVLITKPLGRNAEEAKEMLDLVEKHGVFHGYLEDLCYTPKTHPGPHSDWFWNKELSGGGAIIDLDCHCIEIARNYIGKDVRPVEVMCWADTV